MQAERDHSATLAGRLDARLTMEQDSHVVFVDTDSLVEAQVEDISRRSPPL
jgi:hypothetical protein